MTARRGAGSARPRLLWINQFALLPRDGGGTRHFELGRELVRRGWDVTVAAADFHLHRRQYTRRSNATDRRTITERLDGVDFRWLWAAPYARNDWRRGRNWLTFATSVRRDCRAIARPDVVIGSSPQLFAARAGRYVAREFRVPFVFEVRDLWPESLLAAGSGRKGPAYHVLDAVARRLYRDAERVLVLTQGSRDYLVARGVPTDKCVYVPNGVDLNDVSGEREIERGDGRLTFVYAGAHGLANGLDCVLDAAEILGAAAPVRFLLVGDGPAKPELQRDAVRRRLANVEFVGSVSKPDLMRLMSTADAGLMVLRESPLFTFGVSPNKLFDYFGAALPVACNVRGEVASMVAAAGAGVQAPDASGAGLARVVHTMCELTRERRAAMGRAGRAWVEREHSRRVVGERLDGELRTLLRG